MLCWATHPDSNSYYVKELGVLIRTVEHDYISFVLRLLSSQFLASWVLPITALSLNDSHEVFCRLPLMWQGVPADSPLPFTDISIIFIMKQEAQSVSKLYFIQGWTLCHDGWKFMFPPFNFRVSKRTFVKRNQTWYQLTIWYYCPLCKNISYRRAVTLTTDGLYTT